MTPTHLNDSLHWYMNELTSRVVADSGIPSDRFHIGKLILQSFKDDPDFVAQIDGGTGESETNSSVLKRSIQCAIGFQKLGLKHGDVMVIMAPNHLDLAVPFYAAMYLGITIAPVDRTMKIGELQYTLKLYKPAFIMCHSENVSDIESSLLSLGQTAKIISFDRQSTRSCLNDLQQADIDEVDNFKPADFNPEESIAVILPTSGSTGVFKGAAMTYKAWMITGPYIWVRHTNFPTPTKMWLIMSPIQWITGTLLFITSPFIKFTRLQTSKPVTLDHTRYLIRTYKPTYTTLSSTMMAQLLKAGDDGPCCLTSFDTIMIAGSVVHGSIIQEIKKASPRTAVINGYGLSELGGIAFQGECPLGSPGKPVGIYQYRLVDINTQQDIRNPNVNGELWIIGPGMFKEYYINPEETKKAFADGWFRTGDLFYRDEHWNYYFVERIKMLLKYKSFQIAPAEIESVIREHPGVLDVAVASVPDPECGDLPVDSVIPKPGVTVTAQEIKDLVADKLSDAKQLRGGVVFFASFPVTSTTKIDRRKLNDMLREIFFFFFFFFFLLMVYL